MQMTCMHVCCCSASRTHIVTYLCRTWSSSLSLLPPRLAVAAFVLLLAATAVLAALLTLLPACDSFSRVATPLTELAIASKPAGAAMLLSFVKQ